MYPRMGHSLRNVIVCCKSHNFNTLLSHLNSLYPDAIRPINFNALYTYRVAYEMLTHLS